MDSGRKGTCILPHVALDSSESIEQGARHQRKGHPERGISLIEVKARLNRLELGHRLSRDLISIWHFLLRGFFFRPPARFKTHISMDDGADYRRSSHARGLMWSRPRPASGPQLRPPGLPVCVPVTRPHSALSARWRRANGEWRMRIGESGRVAITDGGLPVREAPGLHRGSAGRAKRSGQRRRRGVWNRWTDAGGQPKDMGVGVKVP